MRRKGRNRIFIAWVLLFTLLPLSLVKATHFHKAEEAAAGATATEGHHNDGCPICQFFLSPFVAEESLPAKAPVQLLFLFIAPPCRRLTRGQRRHCRLRAPPAYLLS